MDLGTPPPRRYDLDALRSVAMLLGIALHAAIPFVPYWEEGDTGGGFLFALFEYIHLWRMPLFFLLSGFFTAMLWQRRGLRRLVKHRLRRIGLPLVLLYIPIMVLIITGIVVGYGLAGADLDDAAAQADDYEEPGSERGDGADADEAEDTFSFAHLWFLWHLLWLVPLFVVGAALLEVVVRGLGRGPPEIVIQASAWTLPLLSLVPFSHMREPSLGPDTSDGLAPAGHVLTFYATFFFFGALVFRRGDEPAPIDRLGRWWPLQLATSIPLFVALEQDAVPDDWSEPLQVLLAWMVSFGAIGLFRSHLHEPSYRIRWLSDSAYWMYLLHLPLVFVFQGVVAGLGLPPIPGFVLIVAATVALLVPSYHYLVRYTLLGTLLNGRRSRRADALLRAQLEDLSRSPR